MSWAAGSELLGINEQSLRDQALYP